MVYSVHAPYADYPSLHAKGAETKHLAPIINILCTENDKGSLHDKHRRYAAQHLARVYEITSQQDLFLNDADVHKLREAGHRFLLHYTALTKWADSSDLFCYRGGITCIQKCVGPRVRKGSPWTTHAAANKWCPLVYKMVPKFHDFWHFLEQARY